MGLLTVQGSAPERTMAGQLLTVCVWLVVAGASVAQPALEWTPETYPNPQKDPAACGRPFTNASWVCDPNGIITVEEADVLDYIISGMVHTDTPCPCSQYECERNRKGYYVGIAIMNKIKRHPNEPDTEESLANAALKFAYDLENSHWHYGNCEQTTIILFSKEDSMLYTVTGGTARLALTDPLVERISSDAWSYFQPGEDISTGLKNMVINFKKVFRNQYYEASYFEDYSTIGGASVIQGGGVMYSLSALLATVFLTWILHG